MIVLKPDNQSQHQLKTNELQTRIIELLKEFSEEEGIFSFVNLLLVTSGFCLINAGINDSNPAEKISFLADMLKAHILNDQLPLILEAKKNATKNNG